MDHYRDFWEYIAHRLEQILREEDAYARFKFERSARFDGEVNIRFRYRSHAFDYFRRRFTLQRDREYCYAEISSPAISRRNININVYTHSSRSLSTQNYYTSQKIFVTIALSFTSNELTACSLRKTSVLDVDQR